MEPDEILKRIGRERLRQDAKWGTEFEGRPDQQWLTILMEEVGEAAQEVLGINEAGTILPEADIDLEAEIVQIAAVCCSWLEFRTPFAEQIRSDVVGEVPDGSD